MEILHVSTELAPLVKVGGLADVVAGLSKQSRLIGHRVTVVLPYSRALQASGLPLGRRLTTASVELGGERFEVLVYDGRLASGVDVVALDVPGFADRAGLYGEEADYEDNPLRFARFCRAAVDFVARRAKTSSPVDVVHVHDWPTALVPYLLAKEELGDHRPPVVLTLHNLAHQGIAPRELLGRLGISTQDFTLDGAEFYGKINLLKLGIVSADSLTTVSETYAREILTPEHGAGLDGLLRSRAHLLTGITNGIDSSIWNPATDVYLPAHYDVEDITHKARCKGAVLAELGLEVATDRPLAIFVGRLVEQKGADVLATALPKIRAAEINIAVAGDGNQALRSRLHSLVEKFPGGIAFTPNASEAIVHRMFAAADFVLMPSRFEPCGLVQLYAQRYGAWPIAHRTGGIRDTVIDCDAQLETGTGFLFDEPSPAALVSAVQRARAAFESSRRAALTRRIMRLERSWERAARQYDSIYRHLSG